MSFATLEEAWGVSHFEDAAAAGGPPPPPAASSAAMDELRALERMEASQRSQLFVTNYLRDAYERHGVAGIMGLLDERAVRDLRMAAIMSFDWLDANVLLFVFMCLCGVWLAMDVLRRGGA
jgi:hypothetical protein